MRLARRLLMAACLLLGIALGYAWMPWNTLPVSAKADRIVVSKDARTLSLYDGSRLIKSYRVSLGSEPVGAKQFEGDGRTPEGGYVIASRNSHSAYHLALRISYPNAADVSRAKAAGKSPAGDIMIHGLRNGLGWLGRWHRWRDWTAGCVAVTDVEMDELWRAVPDGTRVEIQP